MIARQTEKLYMATSVEDALSALSEFGPRAAPLAGATWIMRAPIRREESKESYVGIGRIPELCAVELTDDEVHIGACVTHAALVEALAEVDECEGIARAAGAAANPAVRQMATVGGNLCTPDFYASDLPPALLCVDASLELATLRGRERVSMSSFLERRRSLAPGTLLTRVVVKRNSLRSGHARLPLRRAGDYPVAIVSMAVALSQDSCIDDIRIAVGSVQPIPERWPQLERRLIGRRLRPEEVYEFAKAEAKAFSGREGVEAPGWYRVEVLPTLARRAARAILNPTEPRG